MNIKQLLYASNKHFLKKCATAFFKCNGLQQRVYGFPQPQDHATNLKFLSGWTINLTKLDHTGRKSNTNCHASEEPNLILHPLAEGSAAKELIGEFHEITIYNTPNSWLSPLLPDTKSEL